VLHSVSLINESSVVEDVEVAEIAKALQAQVNTDFGPIWGTNAQIKAVPSKTKPPAGTWWLVLLDDMDQAGALGYHDLTPELLPIGKVGAKTDLEYGAKVSVTCSHELLEMLGDPLINLLVEDPRHQRVYAFENCDAVEADELGYVKLGQTVSDFVLPAYFNVDEAGKGHALSFRGNVTEPFELAKGGYLSYRPVGGAEWKQITDAGEIDPDTAAPERQRAERFPGFPEGSRRERRLRKSAGEPMQVSTAHTA
jgi:hypothetical protein